MSGTARGKTGFSLMRRTLLFACLLIGACSKGPEADLQYIKQARSLGAEWALVNEQASQGKLTETYVAGMHEWIRQQLETTSTSLTQPHARYAAEIEALRALPDDAAPADLRAHSDALKQIEDSLESA